MFARLALLFVVVPILELILLVQMGRYVGWLPTLGLAVTTGIVGAFLARLEGLRVLLGARGELMAGRVPTDSLLNGVCVLIGGALLLTPGILTDLLGFSLIVPLTRRFWARRMRAAAQRGVQGGWLKATVVTGGATWGRYGPGSARSGAADVEGDLLAQEAQVIETIVARPNEGAGSNEVPDPGRKP